MKISKVNTNRNEIKWDGYRIHWEEKSKPLRHHLIILTQQFIPLLLSHSIERIEPLTRMNHSNRWDNSYLYFSNEPLDAWIRDEWRRHSSSFPHSSDNSHRWLKKYIRFEFHSSNIHSLTYAWFLFTYSLTPPSSILCSLTPAIVATPLHLKAW